MAAVRSRGNRSTEERVVRLLRKHGLTGWSRHYPIAGTPDFCWRRQRVALFVDGCFWHGCPHCYRVPKSHAPYWRRKVASNRKRDRRVSVVLRSKGWKVVRLWECRISEKTGISRIGKALRTNRPSRRRSVAVKR
ncbi:MAG: very short patch repair endonuclease [Planctomycetes bacterium]|nr:very short patch repair endonuclease [Planctomycetota bacterium]